MGTGKLSGEPDEMVGRGGGGGGGGVTLGWTGIPFRGVRGE